MLLAIGGQEHRSKTSAIYAFHQDDKVWKYIGDLPFACSRVDTLLLSGGGLLMVDGNTQQVLKITVKGKYSCTGIEFNQTIFRSCKTLPQPSKFKGDKQEWKRSR